MEGLRDSLELTTRRFRPGGMMSFRSMKRFLDWNGGFIAWMVVPNRQYHIISHHIAFRRRCGLSRLGRRDAKFINLDWQPRI